MPNAPDDTDEKLKKLVVKCSRIKISANDINENSNLMSDFGYDSISLIQLTVDIEKEFSMVSDDEVWILDLSSNYSNLKKYVGQNFVNRKA